MIKMRAQQKWLWDHAVYLFFGGLGGAAYVIGAIAGFLGPQWDPIARTGVSTGFPAVAVGSLFLFLGLGAPSRAVHAWKCPGTSWISRGVLFITVFMVAAILHLGLWIWPFRMLEDAMGFRMLISVIGIISGFAVMTYTGFLLGASRPIAFWSTGILPVLFLSSALVSGVLAVLLLTSIRGGVSDDILLALEWGAIVLIIAQALVLTFHMQATHRVPEGKAAASILMKETGANLFWLGTVGLGIFIPLILLLLVVSATVPGGPGTMDTMVIVASLAGLLGNLFLRETVLKGGVLARLKAGRFEYVVTSP
ncbi:MAG: NrfD/PsrC family molybdoenzyme membrane anchor subunit [Candidatus Glassbacteria bacterium]